MKIEEINNELKSFINEADYSGIRTRNKLINLINKYFYTDLPKENYKNIDIQIDEESNVTLRGELYKTKVKVNTKEEVYERYNEFRQEAIKLLDKNIKNYKTIRKNNNIKNILITSLLTLLLIIVLLYSIHLLLRGNLLGFIYIIVIISSYGVIPSLKNRYIELYRSIKRRRK